MSRALASAGIVRGIIDFVAPCHPVPPCGADMDQAFGSPEEPVALDPAVQRLAKADNVAVTVTLLPNGQPHALPTWIDTDGEHLLVNTEPQRQKFKNVRRDPRVTVLIVDKVNPFDFAEVRGRVVETVGGDEARRHIDELSQRYTGGPYQNPIGEQGRVILKIAPDRELTPAALFGGG